MAAVSRKSLLVAALCVGAALLYIGGISPLLRSLQRANIPALPDCTGRPQAVAEYLRDMNDKTLDSPVSGEAVGMLGMAYHAHQFYEQAQACYARAMALNPEEWKWQYYAAVRAEELGDARSVIEELHGVLEKEPGTPHAWFRLGNACLKSRSFPEAEKAFRKVLELPADTVMKAGQAGISGKGAFPLKAYASLQLARVLVQENRLDSAKADLEQLLAAYPTLGPAYRLLGSVCHELGDETKSHEYEVRAGDFDGYIPPADPLYNELVLCSRDTDFLTRQIDIAVKWENYEWTLALIRHVQAYSPHDEGALIRRIRLALDTQKLIEIEPLISEYCEVFGRDELKLLDLARYLRYRGEYEAGVVVLKRIITLDPKCMEAHVEFARMLQTFHQYDMGTRYCNEVIAASPDSAAIRLQLADLLIRQGKLDRAAEQVNIAQRLHPDEEARCLLLGRIAKKAGDAQTALGCFRSAIAANPANATTPLELGQYLLELRRWDEGSRYLRSRLEASPNNIDIMEQYAWLLAACPDQKLRDGKAALELSRRFMLMKKHTIEQEIRCGRTLAAAYGEMRDFDSAIAVARNYLKMSDALRKKDFSDQLQLFIQSFGSRRPYRL